MIEYLVTLVEHILIVAAYIAVVYLMGRTRVNERVETKDGLNDQGEYKFKA